MSDIAIKVENLSKQFQIGAVQHSNLREMLSSMFSRKKDTSIKDFWALQDVSFEIKKGEAVGIIGKNGAGKSTLLKLLSKITYPTKGRIELNGRVASLLEVGTGFHPELTGRENIFLNGTILGMKRAEIKAKFDEIVAFSGVEKFIDTPVKHYSSGMYVRLAFAVAAHLEPEILIIDEVLAVGDAEFQKKCLGKMQDVTKEEGRTVLFVSHNMAAVKSFCNHAILIEAGRVKFDGNIEQAISTYLNSSNSAEKEVHFQPNEGPANEHASLLKVIAKNFNSEKDIIEQGDGVTIEAAFQVISPLKGDISVTFHLLDEIGNLVFVTGSAQYGHTYPYLGSPGKINVKAEIPHGLLHQGTYRLSRLLLILNRGQLLLEVNDILQFTVQPYSSEKFGWQGNKEGIVAPTIKWISNFEPSF